MDTQESLLLLGGDRDLDTELLYRLFLTGAGLLLASLSLPFFAGGGVLEPLLSRRGGGDGERDGLVEYLLRRGGGERETDCDGLRPRRLGGGERDSESDGLRPRRLGGGERDRERLEE
jgi:hypothetical protein